MQLAGINPRRGSLNKPSVIVLLAALVSPHQILADEVYRWVDEHGKTHFSDIPPDRPGTDADVKKESYELHNRSAPFPVGTDESIVEKSNREKQARRMRKAEERAKCRIRITIDDYDLSASEYLKRKREIRKELCKDS